jgi:CHAT domain-containing protein
MVLDLRLSIADSSSGDSSAISKRLAEALLGNVTQIAPPGSHILISPDGALNLLPFAVLATNHGEPLLTQYEISYLNTARELLTPKSRQQGPNIDAIFAAPDFGPTGGPSASLNPKLANQRSEEMDRAGFVFRPLLGAAREAEDVRRALNSQEVHVFIGGDASEEQLKKLSSPRILHIATHGFFLPDQKSSRSQGDTSTAGAFPTNLEDPLVRSGLALAGANQRQSGANDDGILTALELAQLDLHATELAVLSACDSGLGQVQNGEGVFGLRRSLALAGAQSQVTTLWKVSDDATRQLMKEFYQRLLNREGISQAMRGAQLSLLNNPQTAHPYYWASFVVTGKWTPLSTH